MPRIYVHSVIQAIGSFARQDFGRAIRGRNTNSPNTINYLPRNILSFCFTSRLRSGFPLRPISRSLFPRALSLTLAHAVCFLSPTCVNTAIAHSYRSTHLRLPLVVWCPYTLTRIRLCTRYIHVRVTYVHTSGYLNLFFLYMYRYNCRNGG